MSFAELIERETQAYEVNTFTADENDPRLAGFALCDSINLAGKSVTVCKARSFKYCVPWGQPKCKTVLIPPPGGVGNPVAAETCKQAVKCYGGTKK